MKLFFRIFFKMLFILTILVGCATAGELKETDPIELLNQGIALNKEGQYDQVVSYYNKAIKIKPGHARPYHNRGNAYFYKDQYDKAISDYTRAIEINPNYANAYYYRGFAYYKRHQYDMACSDLNRACELGRCEGSRRQKEKVIANKNAVH